MIKLHLQQHRYLFASNSLEVVLETLLNKMIRVTAAILLLAYSVDCYGQEYKVKDFFARADRDKDSKLSKH